MSVTAAELAEMERQVVQVELNASPASFAMCITRGYAQPWLPYQWLMHVNGRLMRLVEGKSKNRLLLTAPPRHGKSDLCSVYFPAWYLNKYPENRIILCAYGDDFAMEWGRKVRDLITGNPENLKIRINDKSKAQDRWDLEGHRGGMKTAGAGGQIVGRGANCFPGDTLISTPQGLRPIAEIGVGDEVYGYDEGIVIQQVQATQSRQTRHLRELQTRNGRILRSTPDHPIYVPGRGYRQTKNLRHEDPLWCLSPMRRTEGKIKSLPELLPRDAPRDDRTGVFVLPEKLHSTPLRSREIKTERSLRHLLHDRMFPSASRDQESQAMRTVRETMPEEILTILLSGVSSQTETTEAVSPMWDAIPPGISPDPILFQGLCEHSPLNQDEGERQLALQDWDQLRQMVSRDAATHHGTRSGLCGLPRLGELRCSPCERDARGQPSREPCVALQTLSCDPPQIESDTVAVVRRLRDREVTVYDLQVEGSHNFFAEGVLVHNCLIIDDPIKDRAEAHSATEREKKWEWWRTTVQSRLEPGAIVVMMHQRWHEDDLAGRVLREEAERWDVVNFPAIAEEEDALGRMPGEALCPERYNENALALIQSSMGATGFSALYQQRPTPEGGGAFKREHFQYWSQSEQEGFTYRLEDKFEGTLLAPQEDCWRFITMDLAVRARETSDYTVAAVWDVAPWLEPSRLILRYIERVRIEGAEHVDMVRRLWETWQPSFIGIEEAMQGTQTIDFARREGIIVLGLKHRSKDKAFRAKDAQLLTETHRVFFPKKADWLAEFEHELLLFPSGTYDDQVDVFSYAAMEVLRGVNMMKRKPEPVPSTLSERAWANMAKKVKQAERSRRGKHPVLGIGPHPR